MQVPKNVMQIGEPDDGCKIYIEDYVCTYIKQLKKEVSGTFKILLYGKQMRQDGRQYYFITAAIREGKDADGWKTTYFPGEKALGYLMIRGDSETLQLNGSKSQAFDGYYIYYEENEAMQSFLVSQHKEEEEPRETKSNVEGRFGLDIQRAERKGADTVQTARQTAKQTVRKEQPEAVWNREHQDIRSFPQWHRKEDETAMGSWQNAKRELTGGSRKGNKAEPMRVKPAYLGCACLLLLLCAVGITTLNHYGKLQNMGTAFSHLQETMKQQSGDDQDGESALQISEIEDGFAKEDVQEAVSGSVSAVSEAPADGNMTEAAEDFQVAVNAAADMTEAAEDIAAVEEATDLEAGTEGGADPADTSGEVVESAQITGIPNLALEEAETAQYETYIVVEGDTLAKISRQIYGDDSRIRDICELNEIANPDHVVPGQKLLLPK